MREFVSVCRYNVSGLRMASVFLSGVVCIFGSLHATTGEDNGVDSRSDSEGGAEQLLQSFADRQKEVNSFRFSWKETVREFKSPFAEKLENDVRAAKTEEERAMAEMMRASVPVEETVYEQKALLIFDGERVRFVMEGSRPSHRDPERVVEPFRRLEVFDGTTTTAYVPAGEAEDKEGRASVYGENKTGGFEYVGARPIILAYRGMDWIRSRRDAGFLDTSEVRTAAIGDRKCIVIGGSPSSIDPPHGVSLWTDPARDHHVLRELKKQGDRIVSQLEIVYAPHKSHGWVPSSWTRSSYWSDGSLRRSVRAEVIEYTLNTELPPGTFKVTLVPGTRVRDSRSDATYHVDEDGGWIPTITPAREGPTTGVGKTLLIVNSALFAVLIALFVWRRFQRSRS